MRNESEEDLSDCDSALELGLEANTEGQVDSRLFMNIEVRETEEVGTRGDKYIVYCIRYDGLTEDVGPDNDDKSSASRLSRKDVLVKRRFREFVNLQNRLEENEVLKKYLRRIKRPSRLRVTPNTLFGSRLEKDTIAHRKVFLEEFLTDLCNRDPIAKSQELQSFLAFGTDTRLAFVKKPTNFVPNLRLDKVLYEGFKEAVNLIKTALPIEIYQEGQFTFPKGVMGIRKGLGDIKTKVGDTMVVEDYLNQWQGAQLFPSQDSQSTEPSPTIGSQRKIPPIDGDGQEPQLPVRGITSDSNCDHDLNSLLATFAKEIPLSNSAVDLFSLVNNESNVCSIYSVIFKALFGHLAEK